jgi:hypothetical protein
MSRRSWVLLVVGVALAGAAVWGGLGLTARSLYLGGAAHSIVSQCLPPHFPVAPVARVTSLSSRINADGVANACTVEFDTGRPPSEVFAFYTSRLPRDGWTVLNADPETGHIEFERARPAAQGSVDVGAYGDGAHVKVAVSGKW